MNKSLSVEKQKYSFSVSAGTTKLDEPIEGIDYEVIAHNLDQVIDWCKTEYDMSKLEEVNSDELSASFEYVYNCDIDGNETDEEPELDEYDQPVEGSEVFYMRDVIEIYGSEISPNDHKYLKSGNYHRTVIDLTEESD